jgi:hypothetical protein
MRIFRRLFLLSLLLSSAAMADPAQTSGSLECEILDDGDRIIRCTYYAERADHDRPITFSWRSVKTPQDDRERTIVLKANNGSLYDYRYYYGRAPGVWNVSVTDGDDNLLSTTSFTIE